MLSAKITNNGAKALFCLTMLVFGTVGIVRVNLPFPSSFIALARAVIACIVISIILLIKRERLDKSVIRTSLPVLCISGVVIGANWITLFEAYRYTSVATATLCYYMAPVFVIFLSPIVLHERLTMKKLICAGVAVAGMVLVSGVLGGGDVSFIGLAFALSSAVLYTSVILMNKRISNVPPLTRTLMQMLSATITLLPYTLLTENVADFKFTMASVGLLLVLGAFHTGVAYVIYFGTMRKLTAQSVALFSYIDPASAVIMSAVVLGESLSFATIIGAILILGATIISELNFKKK